MRCKVKSEEPSRLGNFPVCLKQGSPSLTTADWAQAKRCEAVTYALTLRLEGTCQQCAFLLRNTKVQVLNTGKPLLTPIPGQTRACAKVCRVTA